MINIFFKWIGCCLDRLWGSTYLTDPVLSMFPQQYITTYLIMLLMFAKEFTPNKITPHLHTLVNVNAWKSMGQTCLVLSDIMYQRTSTS